MGQSYLAAELLKRSKKKLPDSTVMEVSLTKEVSDPSPDSTVTEVSPTKEVSDPSPDSTVTEVSPTKEVSDRSPEVPPSLYDWPSFALFPTELLTKTCRYLDVDDLRSFSQTSRLFRDITRYLTSEDLYHILLNSYEHPHHLLLAASRARRLNDWAVESFTHQMQLHDAIERGMEGLADLAVETFPLTFCDTQSVARWHCGTLRCMIELIEDTNYSLAKWVICRRAEEPSGECHMLNPFDVELALLNFQVFQQIFSTRLQKQIDQVVSQDLDVRYSDDNHTRSRVTRRRGKIAEAIEVDFAQYCLPDTRSRYPNLIMEGECQLTNVWRIMWRLGLAILHGLGLHQQSGKRYIIRTAAEMAATQDLDSIKHYVDNHTARCEKFECRRVARCFELGMELNNFMVGNVDIRDFISLTTCLDISFSKVIA
ncbi:MAG: hypothetical protein M1812_003238 [Candelaria pacifica]|nr:MAG: hypothetical protein M1812_003238 [Candelaria pacifica]